MSAKITRKTREKKGQELKTVVYSFNSYPAYLRWLNERNEGAKVFDVSEMWRDKKRQ